MEDKRRRGLGEWMDDIVGQRRRETGSSLWVIEKEETVVVGNWQRQRPSASPVTSYDMNRPNLQRYAGWDYSGVRYYSTGHIL